MNFAFLYRVFCRLFRSVIGSLLFIKEHDIKAFNYSGFQNLPIENITERNSLQKTRYKKAKFIFTMSNWLRDFFVLLYSLLEDFEIRCN